jgi:hypothetical protein
VGDRVSHGGRKELDGRQAREAGGTNPAMRRTPAEVRSRMPHSYTSVVSHLVFSTKNREPLIVEELDAKLNAYIGGSFAT